MQGEPTGLVRVSDDTSGENMAIVPVTVPPVPNAADFATDGAAAAQFALPNQSPAEVAARI